MKFSSLAALAMTLAMVGAVPSAAPAPAENSVSSKLFSMEELQKIKVASREDSRRKGRFAKGKYKSKKNVSKCKNGKVDGTYSCSNVDLHGFLSHEDLGAIEREGNDVWGWTSKDGREFGLVGQLDGTAFVEVNKRTGDLTYVGRLPTQTDPSIWRDIKVIGDYAYIGSEAKDHGLQIFDLKKLLKVKTPTVFGIEKDLTAHFAGFGSSHNIVASESSSTIIAVGTKLCGGGLYMVDISNPAQPKDAGCASEDGYVHDAQCVVYKGPDVQFRGKEICFGFNEDTVTVYDITEKSRPEVVSRTPYVGAAYTHQGWLANDEQTILLADDELDEYYNTIPGGNNNTVTYVWDISKLSAPVHKGIFKSSTKSIDHNQYVINGITYQSNYASGLRIYDVSSLSRSPDGSRVKQLGFFDCYPEDDGAPVNEFFGSWSVYPYFKSGYILLNSIERGVFSLRYTGRR